MQLVTAHYKNLHSHYILCVNRVICKYCLPIIVECVLNVPIVEVHGIQVPFSLSHLEFTEKKCYCTVFLATHFHKFCNAHKFAFMYCS